MPLVSCNKIKMKSFFHQRESWQSQCTFNLTNWKDSIVWIRRDLDSFVVNFHWKSKVIVYRFFEKPRRLCSWTSCCCFCFFFAVYLRQTLKQMQRKYKKKICGFTMFTTTGQSNGDFAICRMPKTRKIDDKKKTDSNAFIISACDDV